MATTTVHSPASPSYAVPTRALLVAGAAAGPLWAAVSLAQAATRDGFDPVRHPLSMLSNGPLGWLQITNFVVAGVLALAGAAGLRRTLRGTPGGTGLPRLFLVYGLGLIAGGIFVTDPADGFAGTPAGPPESLSAAGAAHLAAGAVVFGTVIAANYVLAGRYSRAGRHTAAVVSRVAGTGLLAANAWALSGAPAGSLVLASGSIPAMLWLSTSLTPLAPRAA